jgi:pentatricopeptide repeat protein
MAGIAGVVIGLALGLIIGWWVWPVEWTDASPALLRQDLRVDFVRMSIDSFSRTGNVDEARRLFAEMGAAGEDALAAVEANPGYLTLAEIAAFRAAVTSQLPGGGGSGQPAEEGGASGWLWIACIMSLVLGLLVVAAWLFRRGPVSDEESAAQQAAQVSRTAERTDYAAMGQSPPLSQFMTTFLLGDDLFDDSFSIESPAGEFLGECGVGIAETVGPGEPKRVNAFEVWLFDKNDIQTVTKVLLSQSAFNDMITYDRLSAKGDPVSAEPNGRVVLETAKLRLVARVVDLEYGSDAALAPNSHFTKLTLELAVWPR